MKLKVIHEYESEEKYHPRTLSYKDHSRSNRKRRSAVPLRSENAVILL